MSFSSWLPCKHTRAYTTVCHYLCDALPCCAFVLRPDACERDDWLMPTNEPTAETRRLAAVSRMTPSGSRDSNGKLLPLRYRAAERVVAEYEMAGAK